MRVVSALAASAAVLAALATGAGAANLSPADSQARATVKVVLTEFDLLPSRKRVAAGTVTFVVRNAGKLAHEFVLTRTDRQPNALPVTNGKASVRELAEVGGIQPGETRRLTVKLKAGKYVLLCNLLGHYQAGQYAGFRVG